jgi:uncharacterized cupin superfamily protein
MTGGMTPIRRLVTGNDAEGRSKVVWDGPAPDVHPLTPHANPWTDFWVWKETPMPIDGEDGGNLDYDFPGPAGGGHFRAVVGYAPKGKYDQASDAKYTPPHTPKMRPAGRTWDRGGRNAFTSDMHKTETIDYAILFKGERNLILDDGEVSWKPGDIVIDVGAYHQWTSPRQDGIVLYDMIAAHFPDGPVGLVQGNDKVMTAAANHNLPDGVRPARRIVCLDKEPGKSSLVSDGPTPDVRLDPARPGFASQRLWVTDSFPAKIVFETLHLPHTIEPPKNGTVLRSVTIPPDDVWMGKAGSGEVASYFRAMGSPGASTYSAKAPHPYMQKTRSIDFCVIQEGEVVLVLDTQEVPMKEGEIAILRGANHAWSNRSANPAVIAIASHDAM